MRESKDKIKSRMIRNAAQIWGFREPQAESSFDPLVSLLLGACAFELEKISGEINNSESRIIERMVNILTPQPITSPHPAYAVAYAKPYRASAKILPENQFCIGIKVNDRFEKKSEDKQLFFSPTGTFNLTDGRVRYIAANKSLYEITEDNYKDIVTENLKNTLPRNSLFIGLEINDEATKETTLFFDVVSEHLKDPFFNDLGSCQWKAGESVIDIKKGLNDSGQPDHNIHRLISRNFDLSSKFSWHINSYFNHHFITINLKDILNTSQAGKMKVPEIITASIDEKDLSNIAENIIWIEAQFPKPVSGEVPENLVCSLNCFPVINRRLNEYSGSTRDLINIIPLHTEDVFFDLKSVTNSNGEVYKINNFISPNDISKGSALLRSDGVGRFDSRNAMEYLDYLLELMKEESAAFNVIGSDMIASNLRELNQAIARLEKKIEDVQFEEGDTAYLMLKPQDGDRQVFVEFWSTNCTQANNIRAGSTLNVFRADDIDYNASRLMTTTTGGKEKPTTEARINTFRRYLQSGDRIVTTEDIKAVCFENFGDLMADVKIEKGIEKGTGKSEGFIRTIDIFMSIKKGHDIDLAEQSRIRQSLLVLLEERSSNIFPFRIFFGN
jgi:hypothetical protein